MRLAVIFFTALFGCMISVPLPSAVPVVEVQAQETVEVEATPELVVKPKVVVKPCCSNGVKAFLSIRKKTTSSIRGPVVVEDGNELFGSLRQVEPAASEEAAGTEEPLIFSLQSEPISSRAESPQTAPTSIQPKTSSFQSTSSSTKAVTVSLLDEEPLPMQRCKKNMVWTCAGGSVCHIPQFEEWGRCIFLRDVGMECGTNESMICRPSLKCMKNRCYSISRKWRKCDSEWAICEEKLSCIKPKDKAARCMKKKKEGERCKDNSYWLCDEGLNCEKQQSDESWGVCMKL